MRGCGNEPIHCLDWPTARLVPCHQSPPFIRDGTVDQGDSPLESLREFAAQPRVKVPAPTACRQPLDAVTQLCEGDDAEEDLVLIDLRKPLNDSDIRTRLSPFGDYIRVKQIPHRSIGRNRSLERGIFNPEPRNGEALKKSASVPAR